MKTETTQTENLLQSIISNYVQIENERTRLENKIKYRQRQIERLEKKKSKLKCHWTRELLIPIVKELEKITNRKSDDYDFIPTGLLARVTVILFNETHTNYICFQFIPKKLTNGEIAILDLNGVDENHTYSNDPHGFAYPAIPLPSTFEEFLQYSITEECHNEQ